MGAMAATTTGAFPAVTATAATVDIPGIGKFDVPDQFAPQVDQFNEAVKGVTQNGFQVGANPAPEGGQWQLPSLANPFDQKPSSPANIALNAAETKLGAQYSWGASGPYSFDCSGLVQWAYKQAGVDLPRTSFEQSHVGAPVAYQDLQPGDIVITNGGGHVGIYAGDNQLLNAVQSGTPVSYTPLRPDMVVTARRVV
ncbi:C40 family peptidase [Nocardia huaxiensis]|uniref:C40 family peptidase n=1 Tax=Nocardia huaxiensis TaxID=2755382 RepID=A0A7D6VP06_9NOCA|nr:NlpC/P60 family protein [Nocardia huaxiensis]QLY34030.1 C40 family peptidase [Nocardia huaxiensis]UFT00175.1 C40 family peptidase [Nocardia huaxiensis]